MAVNLDLYIDESGDFNDARPDRPKPTELSMVGGILCDPAKLTKGRISAMFPKAVHCQSGYKKSYIKLLEDLKQEGHRFVVFENTEQILVVNTDYTYINIISEGLVKLFRDLAIQYPDGVSVNVIIAQRMLKLKEYRDRIIEKTLMAYGREKIQGCNYSITISDARYDKRLFIADIVCNTYLTRNRVDKFSANERNRIAALFSPEDVYPVFEDATVAYIRQLLLDGHWGEAICQICSLPHLKTLTAQRDNLVRRLLSATRQERDYSLGRMTVELKLCEDHHQYEEGISLGENFIRYFLDRLDKHESIRKEVAFWRFDTDFHLLTMYDHLGNTAMMEACLNACRENLDAVSTSWEELDYYFLFRIRELNTLMDLFRFEEVLEKADQYKRLFADAQDFFGKIRDQAGIQGEIRSDSLGKVEGIRLQAMINLVSRRPELFEEALAASDKALSEFDRPDDLIRQWGYRSKLMLEAGRPKEALDCILKIAELIDGEGQSFEKVMNHVYQSKDWANEYLLLNYTGVMVALVEAGDPAGTEMAGVMINHPRFNADLRNGEKGGYPWNVILWHIAQYLRIKQKISVADSTYRRAVVASVGNKNYTTVMSFAVAIAAEHLVHSGDRSDEARSELERQWEKANQKLNALGVPVSIREWFGTEHPDAELQARSAWK